ncbi:MAG: M4 family metallopeptidase [Saprospirales bacterium]|nr:M4 family metallopeptidase [Saprospirales bacterium]
MKKHLILSAILWLCAIATGLAQQPAKVFPEFISIDDTNALMARTNIFQRYYQIKSTDELRLMRTKTDHLGVKREKFQQYYKGVPVDGATVTVHTSKAGRVTLLSGFFVGLPETSVRPAVSAERALAAAIAHVGARQYKWDDPKEEALLKKMTGNPNATHYPKGELVIAEATSGEKTRYRNFVLAWKFDIREVEGLLDKRVFINATTGQLIKSFPLAIECDPGTAATTWHGNQTIQTDFNGANFILFDDCPGHATISTVQEAGLAEYTDADNIWNAAGQTGPATSHYYGRETIDYYAAIHGRNSYDDGGGGIQLRHRAGMANAFWSGGGVIVLGANANDARYYNTLDVVAHEFTHGVVETEAALVYQGESGALNESFADILGETCERWSENHQNIDWLHREDYFQGENRSFIDPNDEGDPDTYGGTNWANTCMGCSDAGGVHTNSGVQNHWFYLLTDGGTGVNDNGDTYCVSGIGIGRADSIAYLNLTGYLSANSDYAAARAGAILAARALYGAGSAEEIATTNAWHAVGVGGPYNFPPAITCPTMPATPFNNDPGLCSAVVAYPPPVAETNCPVITQLNGLPSGAAFPVGTTLNIFRVTDAAGGSSSVCAFTIVVRDVEKPNLACPSDKTIGCEESTAPANTGSPAVSDNCGIAYLTYVDTKTPGGCPGNYTISRNWIAVDVNGNMNDCTQIITVQDIKAPVITCPANITVVCDISPDSTGYATAADNCDPNPGLTYSDRTTGGNCDWLCTIERTWVATDYCGNVSTCVQRITKDVLPLLEKALKKDVNGDGVPDPLVLGVSNSTLTIPPGRGNCIQKWLPSTGATPSGLKFETTVVGVNCRPGTNPVAANGSLVNPLLAEALFLNIMVRLDPALGPTKLSALPCSIAPVIIHYLATDPDINELLRFTNTALGNVAGQPHLKELLETLKCINAPLNVCGSQGVVN